MILIIGDNYRRYALAIYTVYCALIYLYLTAINTIINIGLIDLVDVDDVLICSV